MPRKCPCSDFKKYLPKFKSREYYVHPKDFRAGFIEKLQHITQTLIGDRTRSSLHIYILTSDAIHVGRHFYVHKNLVLFITHNNTFKSALF